MSSTITSEGPFLGPGTYEAGVLEITGAIGLSSAAIAALEATNATGFTAVTGAIAAQTAAEAATLVTQISNITTEIDRIVAAINVPYLKIPNNYYFDVYFARNKFSRTYARTVIASETEYVVLGSAITTTSTTLYFLKSYRIDAQGDIIREYGIAGRLPAYVYYVSGETGVNDQPAIITNVYT